MDLGGMAPLSKQKAQAILGEYRQLLKAVVRGKAWAYPDVLLTPKPITLQLSHLVPLGPNSYGAHSVWYGYAVTTKADGQRALLFVSGSGKAYLINQAMDVTDTALRAANSSLHCTLLDGELIAVDQRTDGVQKPLFAAFDIYFCSGEALVARPLFCEHPGGLSRYDTLQNACAPDQWAGSGVVDVCCKEHIRAEGAEAMQAACCTLLEARSSLPYHSDGLVFTPAALSVLGHYPGRAAAIGSSMRWDQLLKWKPAHHNSIDFLVEKGLSRFDPESKQFQHEWILHTGYSPSFWQPVSVMDGVRLLYDRHFAEERQRLSRVYEAKRFQPVQFFEPGVDTAWIAVRNDQSLAADGSVVQPHSIVEFAYHPDPSLPPPLRWSALRVRLDKTYRLWESGAMSKTANDLTVALSIWRSMHVPVTAEMLTGRDPLPPPQTMEGEGRAVECDDLYFVREVPREHLASVHMLNFHNHGVKKMLYEWVQDREALLDLACGRGGDLPRWRDGAWRFVLGVDLVKDNICNPRNGAYARMQQQRINVRAPGRGAQGPLFLDHVFVVGDCTKPLQTGDAARGLDAPSVELLQVLYDQCGSRGSPPPHLRHIHSKATHGFTAVACMFALHYFFKDEASLDGLLWNVASNLRSGGGFISTFMDGERVHDLLCASPAGRAEGRLADGGVVVWALARRYETWDAGDAYGKLVDVYLENINRLIPEYLVSLPTLVAKARAFGLEVEATDLFSVSHETLLRAVPADRSQRSLLDEDVLALAADPITRQFSFLNRWVVFRKV
eukprot:GGOE01015313.1.p1 GENE.GGOE01015313.1~~GGOE01015313.1.p1  ORF type:complete len:783 (+),score=173.50 GGOE01015313.1:58-2406(+)